MTSSKILITGGTGRTGRRVADRVIQRGFDTRITSRAADVPFDWNDERTWDAALHGCSAAYVCYSPDLALPGVDAVIEKFSARATAAGVNKLVLLSGRGEDGALACERAVLAASATGSVVRCSWFQENFSEHFLRDGVLAGRVAVPASDVREPFVSLDDVADVAALALTSDAFAGRVLELTGPEAITFTDAARDLSRALGRDVRYEPVDGGTFVTEQVAAGVDREEAEGLAWLFAEVLDGRNSASTDTVQELLGRPARSFAAYADGTAASGAWS